MFVRVGGPDGDSPLGPPMCRSSLGGGGTVCAYPADAAVIDAFCRALAPSNAPRALGRTPRLGIGTRMTTKVWPAIFAAMDRKHFAANSIQNSVRELNLLDDLREGKEPERNYASGFGMIESGYTGSTFEGLWVYGVLAALEHDRPLAYGADADHIQFKRADRDFARVDRVVRAARYYTFFTLDTADVLSYDSFERRGEGELLLGQHTASAAERSDLLAWHAEPLRVGPCTYRLDADTVGRCVAKYGAALDATAALNGRLMALRGGAPFDLEFAFDEHPPEVSGPDCISSEEEVVFVVRELARRGLPATHIAPNFGIEKGFDYRIADGLPGLRARVEAIFRIAEADRVPAGFPLRGRPLRRDAEGDRPRHRRSAALQDLPHAPPHHGPGRSARAPPNSSTAGGTTLSRTRSSRRAGAPRSRRKACGRSPPAPTRRPRRSTRCSGTSSSRTRDGAIPPAGS